LFTGVKPLHFKLGKESGSPIHGLGMETMAMVIMIWSLCGATPFYIKSVWPKPN
jgi:hypothetical protein